ncbi:MAG: acetyl-CoA carboxylase biotin carboxyl carrier protein [Nitrospirae bacterium]|nr:acetyl-CoA carboxylase biotin carboxyl carrier protein [Nitrospirota bacterium]
MNLKEIRDLIALLQGTDIYEFQLERGGVKVRIRRGAPLPEGREPAAAPPRMEEAFPQEPRPVGAPISSTDRLITVTSPIVGTFYRAPSPEAQSFVEIGDRVKKGQVLCLIEAMKLMNEIESEADGTVVKILAESAQPVEYGEPLFLIEPA